MAERFCLVEEIRGESRLRLGSVENKKEPLLFVKSSSDFKMIYRKGKRVFSNSWMLLNYLEKEEKRLRYGWTVPKFVGSAVTRNKLKRWCREIVRKDIREETNSPYDINIVFRKQPQEFYKSLNYEVFRKALLSGSEKIFSSGKKDR